MNRRDFFKKGLSAVGFTGLSILFSGANRFFREKENISNSTLLKNLESGMNEKQNILITYFSWSGNTRGIAGKIHKIIGGDLIEVVCVNPYSRSYNTCLNEAQRDQRKQVRPELKTHIPDFAKYDTVLLGYPNWWASIPMPIASLLEKYDFAGKTIIPFCSHGGGRLGQSLSAIGKLTPRSKITEALSVHYSGGSSLPNEISAWLHKVGITVK